MDRRRAAALASGAAFALLCQRSMLLRKKEGEGGTSLWRRLVSGAAEALSGRVVEAVLSRFRRVHLGATTADCLDSLSAAPLDRAALLMGAAVRAASWWRRRFVGSRWEAGCDEGGARWQDAACGRLFAAGWGDIAQTSALLRRVRECGSRHPPRANESERLKRSIRVTEGRGVRRLRDAG